MLTTPSGGAARLLVVYRTDPYAATAIDQVGALRARLPALVAAAGLGRPTTALAGDRSWPTTPSAMIRSDLVRVVVAVLLVNLILLILFLRALIAPVLLVAASALSVAAAIGITTWTFQTLLGYHQLTYYVPFAAGVLLVSLGSDYNVFVAGRVWQEARVRPLRDALRIAPARTTAASAPPASPWRRASACSRSSTCARSASSPSRWRSASCSRPSSCGRCSSRRSCPSSAS